MPGLGAPVSLEWCRTSDPATSASTPGRPIMNRSSLPPLTTPSLASHRSAAGQARLKAVPTWTPRRSSPPSTTYRSYSPIPSFSPGQLSSRPEQDLDAFATWAHAPHHSHHASPTSNDSSDDLFHMSRNSALKHRSPEPSFSVTTKSVFSPSSDFLMSSDEEAGNGSLSDSRRRKDLQSQHGTVEIDSEGSSSSQDHEQAKLLGQRSALSPPYHAGPSPHYRATEPALADHGYTEAIRIANADFDHWQRLSTSAGDIDQLLAQISNLHVQHEAASASYLQDVRNHRAHSAAPNPRARIIPELAPRAPPVVGPPHSGLIPPPYGHSVSAAQCSNLPVDIYSPSYASSTTQLIGLPPPDLSPSAQSVVPKKKESLYKTELCRGYEERGHCDYGAKCQFAHGKHELRSIERHPKWKTERCRTYWRYGTCPYAKRCCFIHEASEGEMNASLAASEAVSKAPLLARVRAISSNAVPTNASPTDSESPSFSAFARSAPSFIPRAVQQDSFLAPRVQGVGFSAHQ